LVALEWRAINHAVFRVRSETYRNQGVVQTVAIVLHRKRSWLHLTMFWLSFSAVERATTDIARHHESI